MAVEGWITTEEYGGRQEPELSLNYVGELCRAGKVPGAVKVGRDWLIPEDTPNGAWRGRGDEAA